MKPVPPRIRRVFGVALLAKAAGTAALAAAQAPICSTSRRVVMVGFLTCSAGKRSPDARSPCRVLVQRLRARRCDAWGPIVPQPLGPGVPGTSLAPRLELGE